MPRFETGHGLDGDYLKHGTFRLRHWTPALKAAGLDHRGVYACRHTFAAGHRAGVQLYLSRIMGTSVAQIDQTYGRLVPDSEEYLRGLLDTYDHALLGRPRAKRNGSAERIRQTSWRGPCSCESCN